MKTENLTPSQKTGKNYSSSSGETEVRQMLTELTQAMRDGNLEKIMSLIAEDIVIYDCPPPLQVTSKSDYRKVYETFVASAIQFPMVWESRDMHLSVQGDTAISYALCHIKYTFKESKEKVENWLRSTIISQKRDGKWLIVHIHNSVPIGEDMNALMNLSPDVSLEECYSEMKH